MRRLTTKLPHGGGGKGPERPRGPAFRQRTENRRRNDFFSMPLPTDEQKTGGRDERTSLSCVFFKEKKNGAAHVCVCWCPSARANVLYLSARGSCAGNALPLRKTAESARSGAFAKSTIMIDTACVSLMSTSPVIRSCCCCSEEKI